MVGVGGDIYGGDYREAMTIAAIGNSSHYLSPELQNLINSVIGNTFSIDVRSAAAEQVHQFEVGNDIAQEQQYYQEYAQVAPQSFEQNWENAMAQVAELVNMGDLSFENITLASSDTGLATSHTAKEHTNDIGIA